MPENSDPRPAEHWGTRDPAGEPDRDLVIGVGRMVMEARTRLGDGATPADVLRELQARGVEVTADDVGRFWEAG
jgi:hypothetical protein